MFHEISHEFDEIPQSNLCGKMVLSQGWEVFDEILQSNLCVSYRNSLIAEDKDGISWNLMIGRCVQTRIFDEDLNLLRQILIVNVEPLKVSLSVILLLPAFGQLMTLLMRKHHHAYVGRTEFDCNMCIASSLVNSDSLVNKESMRISLVAWCIFKFF